MSTITVLDSTGTTQTVQAPLAPGQAAMAASRPVVIASDQSVLAVSLASQPLPTGASTSANQTALNALFPTSLGQKAMAASLAVAIASDQSTLPVSAASLPLPTGASTSANQSTVLTAIGAPADAAWTSGSGSHTALLKAIAANAISTSDSPVEVHQPCDVISFTPTLDTAVYAAGDVLFATAAITGVTRANDLRANLISLTAIDKSKQNPAITLLFYQTNVTSAAANAANALSDADQANCLGFVNIAAADWLTFANNSVLCYSGSKAPNLLVEAATGTTTVYVVGILQAGTPTFAVGDLVLKLGFVQQ